MMRRLLIPFLLIVVVLGGPPAAQAARDVGPRPPGQFDYYVLSLTWVPGFCAHNKTDSECSKGLGFALHGL